MFHRRQQPLVTIIITISAKRRLMRIMLLHLGRKSLVALSNSNVRVK
jgi:hypothetical protein